MRYVSLRAALTGVVLLMLNSGCAVDMRFDDGSRPSNPLSNPSCSRIAQVPSQNYCDYVALLSSDPRNAGSGTGARPYEICTPAQIVALSSDPTLFSAHFKLVADVDMSCVSGHAPIGTSANPFQGVFDGDSKTIRNWVYEDATQDRVGFFGYVKGGAIKNLTVLGRATGKSYVGLAVGLSDNGHLLRVSTAGTVTGSVYVGGVTGRAELGAVNQCRSSATVNGVNDVGGVVGNGGTPLVVSSEFTGRVISSGTNTGGIIGNAYFGYVLNSYSSGTITSSGPNVGGISGSGGSSFTNTYSTGAVSGTTNVGGLLGNSTATLRNSFTTALVSGSGGTNTNVGFLRALSGGSTANSYYWSGASCDADSLVGGTQACGTTASGTVTDVTTFQSRTNEPLASWDFQGEGTVGTSDLWAARSLDFPVAWYVEPANIGIPFFDGDGTRDRPYEISTTTQFNLIASNPRWMEKHFKLTANLDFNGVTPKQIGSWVAPFSGTFDGGGKTIGNYVAAGSTTQFQGIFGLALNPAEIRDLNVVGASISGTIFTAALVGHSTGDVTRVSVEGSVAGGWHSGGLVGVARTPGSITDSSASTRFSVNSASDAAIGGLVGNSDVLIVRSISASTITGGNRFLGGMVGSMGGGAILNSLASGSIGNGAHNQVGGLVGYMLGGARVENSYSTADVRGLQKSGGLVGEIVSGTVTNSFATGSVQGNGGATVVGPLVGSLTAGTVTNSWVVAGTFCDSSTAGGTQACNTSFYAGQAAAVSDFYDPTNAPLSSWDFVTTWQSDLLSLPVLR